MKKNENHIAYSRKGTIQGQQVPAALSPSHFVVDERDQKRLLKYCADVSSVLDYYNLRGNKEGNWSTFLLADTSVLTATMAQHSSTTAFNQMLGFLQAIQSTSSVQEHILFAQKFFGLGFDVVLKVDNWFKLSNQNLSTRGVTSWLQNEIQSKGCPLLKDLYAYYFSLTETLPHFTNEALQRFSTLERSWCFDPFPEIQTSAQKLSEVVTRAAQPAQLLYSWLNDIVDTADGEFQEAVQRNDIPPHVGLLLTFLEIFKSQQEAMNGFTGRHLEFYFSQILKAQKRKAVPDTTVITLELVKTNSMLIPAGTRFDAGLDSEKKPVIFKTTSDQLITANQVVEYQTLTFPQSSTGGIQLGNVKKYNEIGSPSWPLFGPETPTDSVSLSNVSLGFAFSCPDLFTSQSTRKITITFKSGITGTGLRDANDLFHLYMTTSQGWFAPAIESITLNEVALSFVCSFKISDPAVIAYSEKLHGKGFDTAWPICQVKLSDHGARDYQILRDLTFDTVSVTAEVTGVTNFVAENDLGKFNAAMPFNPFNIQSGPYNLYIGSQEFFVKSLSDLTLNITWDNLPPSFAKYYSAYNDYYRGQSQIAKAPVFLNQAFVAELCALDDGTWVPVFSTTSQQKYRTKFELFTNDDVTTKYEKSIVDNGIKSITLQGAIVGKNKIVPLPSSDTVPAFTAFSNTLPAGFLRITMSAPDQGFGYTDYPGVVSEVALANSQAMMHNARPLAIRKWNIKPMPNIPYSPRIKSLAIDYNASQEYHTGLAGQAFKYYHLHPSGADGITLPAPSISILPDYEHSSYIYLGFDSPITAADISLFFLLDNPAKSIDSKISLGPDGQYLSTEGWKPLEILVDTTSNFQQTGIIRFSAPADFTQSGTQMSSALYWVRFGGDVNTKISVSFVSAQAIELTREQTGSGNIVPIASGTISKALDSLAGIKKITQPIASSGELAEQTDNEFQRTTAVRLRDKGRISTVSSIESSLLENFPALYKVTAVPLGYSDPTNAGTVQVILVPFVSPASPGCFRPLTSIASMEDVMKYLMSAGLPHVNYQVSNSDFYDATVTCSITFTSVGQDEKLARQLNTDLNEFMSPWIKDGTTKIGSDSNYSGQVYAFVKARDYVKSISSFNCAITPLMDGTIPPQALIVPALEHNINKKSIPEKIKNENGTDGLRIGKNFFITT